MRSMKAYIPILLLGLLTSMTGTLAAQDSHLSFTGGVMMLNPCTNDVFYVSGPTNIDYSWAGALATVHLRFDAAGQDGSTAYQTSLEANYEFSTMASFYDLPFHSVWVGQGSVPNFTLDGNVRVYMNADETAPVGDQILSDTVQLTCSN